MSRRCEVNLLPSYFTSLPPHDQQLGGPFVLSHLTPNEMLVFIGLGRLRVSRYVGTVGELYTILTGKPHPKKVSLRVGA